MEMIVMLTVLAVVIVAIAVVGYTWATGRCPIRGEIKKK